MEMEVGMSMSAPEGLWPPLDELTLPRSLRGLSFLLYPAFWTEQGYR